VLDTQGWISPVAATTSACTACHQNLSALAHAVAQTDPKFGESCDVCHATGADFDVDKGTRRQIRKRTERHVRAARTLNPPPVSPCASLMDARRGLVGAAMLLAVIGSAQEKACRPAAPPPENKPAEFVGSTTCQMCHEDIFNAFQKNPHQQVETDKKRGWDTKACESCHGPGSKHAESARRRYQGNPPSSSPPKPTSICLTCHLNQPTHADALIAVMPGTR
jgi:hypothetical protein